MPQYSSFDIADFAADERFVQWVIHPSEPLDQYWAQVLQEHPELAKKIHEARLVVLLMHSRNARLDDDRREELWSTIRDKTIAKQEARPRLHRRKVSLVLKVAAAVAAMIAVAYALYPIAISSPEVIVIANPKGHKSVHYLPDGTTVWLNADSRLSYAPSFAGLPERKVVLEGEAFFDVVKDAAHPFIVQTSQLQVKVLGTSFNVRSYEDQPTVETTLVEGKVSIALSGAPDGAAPIIMQEQEQAVYSTVLEEIVLKKVDARSATSWKEGKLIFNDTPFTEIERELERWYGVEIVLEDELSGTCRFSTTIENEPIDKILELFKTTSGIAYEVDGEVITLKGALCRENN